jgi:hypothetical protein
LLWRAGAIAARQSISLTYPQGIICVHPEKPLNAPAARVDIPAWLERFPRAGSIYQKYEKFLPVAVFAIGFLWDSITMTRVDSLIDNIILLFYLASLGVMIYQTVKRQCGMATSRWMQRLQPHFLWAMQFCYGGMFSSFVVFYFKSVSWTGTQFFFLILVALLIGNEFLHHRLGNPVLLAILYSFCLISYLAFFLPVILARIGPEVFLLAGCLSLVISFLVFAAAYWPERDLWAHRMKPITTWIAAIFVAGQLLYFANLIPPVPLSLKSAGIYHSVTRTSAGYQVQNYPTPLYRFWKRWDDPFYYSPGQAAFCYTAIFAPPGIEVPIIHVWSRQTASGWTRTDRIRFDIAGGREMGYRGFTRKGNLPPGNYRVDVETERGQILGRVEFAVIVRKVSPVFLETRIIR